MKMREKLTTNGETPMLLNDNGYILTKNKFTIYIQEAIDTLDPTYKDIFKDLKGHSLRSGVPTALQKLGSEAISQDRDRGDPPPLKVCEQNFTCIVAHALYSYARKPVESESI